MPSGRSWKKYVQGAVVAVAIVGFALALHSASKKVDITKVIHPQFLLLAYFLFLIHYGVQGIGWHLILRSLGLNITFPQSQKMWFSSLMARYIPGPFVYSVARMYLAKEYGLPVGVVAYGVVLEMAYVVVGSMVATFGFLGGLSLTQNAALSGKAGIAAVVIIVLSLLICFQPRVLKHLLFSKPAQAIIKRLTKRELHVPDIPPLNLGKTLGLLIFYSLFWIYSGFILFFLAASIAPLTVAQAPACIRSFAGSWFVGFLVNVAPAGIGVRELALYVLMGNSLQKAQVIVLAVLMRIGMLLSEFSVVLIAAAAGKKHDDKVKTLAADSDEDSPVPAA